MSKSIPDDVQRWRDSGNTLPVARDLAFLDSIGVLERVEGHSRGMSFFPFLVRLVDGSYHGHPTELHETTQRWRERYEMGEK